MIATSKDILFLAIGGSIILLTIFMCWGLYYLVMILKRVHITVKEVSNLITSIKERLEKLDGLINTIEEKIKHSASYPVSYTHLTLPTN